MPVDGPSRHPQTPPFSDLVVFASQGLFFHSPFFGFRFSVALPLPEILFQFSCGLSICVMPPSSWSTSRLTPLDDSLEEMILPQGFS